MTFGEYVDGKTIAIVGPAPMPVDQSAEIDAHDIVARPVQCPIGGRYGQRLDVAFLNGACGRTILEDDQAELRDRIQWAEWWVYKGGTSMQARPIGKWRNIIKPKLRMNLNAVTGILFDLMQFRTGKITVYGADLYASGPGNAYHADYDRRDAAGQASGFILHEPWKQMRVHRACVATGRVVGDDRYLAAVSMTDDEYQAVIDRWKAALEEAP